MKLITVPAVLLVLAAPGSRGQIQDDLTLGVEAVTGVRSDYVYRGFQLADAVMDFQLEGEIALGGDFYLDLGGWFASETGGDFSETAGFADLRRALSERFTAGGVLGYHSYHRSLFDSGLDLGAYLTFFPAENWSVTAEASRDFGAAGWWANAETGWSRRLTDHAFLTIRGGLSAVDGYYGRSGFNDLHGRASLTCNLNRMVSLTPFVGGSVELLDGDGNEWFGGLWFEVSF